MPYHFESAINAINGHHFENLNLEGLVNYVDAADLSIDNNRYGEFDDQYGTIQNELAEEPAVFYDYGFDNETGIIYQQAFQQHFDYETVQVQQDYQGEVIDCVEAPVGMAGGYMAGNETYYAGNYQFVGNNGHLYAAPHHHLQNHQQFGWSAEAVGEQLAQEHHLPEDSNQFYETHQVENQENVDPVISGVAPQNLQFAMPQYSVGVDYEQRSPQKLVQEEQPTEVMLEAEVIALDSVLANQLLDEKVDFIDTKEMMGRLKVWMTKTGKLQKSFAERILNTSPGTLSDMVNNPKRFENLGKGRMPYYRIFNFLKYNMELQDAFFQLQLFSPKEVKAGGPKSRTKFTPEQSDYLKAYFEMKKSPSRQEEEEIARVLNLTHTIVYNFFRNNRKARKNK
ncbi:unnamed protein product [Caenorhabditis brenneri]